MSAPDSFAGQALAVSRRVGLAHMRAPGPRA